MTKMNKQLKQDKELLENQKQEMVVWNYFLECFETLNIGIASFRIADWIEIIELRDMAIKWRDRKHLATIKVVVVDNR